MKILLLGLLLIITMVTAPYLAAAKPFDARTIISHCGGAYHACFVFQNGKVKCAGQGLGWGLGLTTVGDTRDKIQDNIPFVDLGPTMIANKASCGAFHVCFRFKSKEVKCLGNNLNGQSGIASLAELVGSASAKIGNNLPVVKLGTDLEHLDLALGDNHACVKVTGNRVKCFGLNSDGQLGYGDDTSRGKDKTQMNDNLPFVDLGTNVEISTIHSSSSATHTCVILSAPAQHDQRIKCWGLNSNYQLGYGHTDTRGTNPTHMGDNLPLVNLGAESKVKTIAVGAYHTCALLVNDGLKCWGSGAKGQLGSGSSETISATGDGIPTVKIDSGKVIKQITAGSQHTCILYDDMLTMKCFGVNDEGELGQGDKTQRGNTQSTTIPNIPAIDLGTGPTAISFISSALLFNCVAFVDKTIKCFGYNQYGEFAIGTLGSKIGSGEGQMGGFLQQSKLFSPSLAPTRQPTHSPTLRPTERPSKRPTRLPTQTPTTAMPTKLPTTRPTTSPTQSPTNLPTSPTLSPTSHPTSAPTPQNNDATIAGAVSAIIIIFILLSCVVFPSLRALVFGSALENKGAGQELVPISAGITLLYVSCSNNYDKGNFQIITGIIQKAINDSPLNDKIDFRISDGDKFDFTDPRIQNKIYIGILTRDFLDNGLRLKELRHAIEDKCPTAFVYVTDGGYISSRSNDLLANLRNNTYLSKELWIQLKSQKLIPTELGNFLSEKLADQVSVICNPLNKQNKQNLEKLISCIINCGNNNENFKVDLETQKVDTVGFISVDECAQNTNNDDDDVGGGDDDGITQASASTASSKIGLNQRLLTDNVSITVL